MGSKHRYDDASIGPPPAHLRVVVFRDGSQYLLFPHIELTPISLEDGAYTYTFGPQVTLTLDTNTTPATFSLTFPLG